MYTRFPQVESISGWYKHMARRGFETGSCRRAQYAPQPAKGLRVVLAMQIMS